MSKELKACPFCGGKAEIRHVKAFYDNKSGKHLGYFVLCPKCLTSSDNYSSEDNAANHWNKRLKRNSYRFYQNTDCEYYPCHQVADTENFSCLFCYCPLYRMEKCPGNPEMLANGIKDCSNCTLPHTDYDAIVEVLKT